MGSWRPWRPQTGVPDGLVWADPPRVFVLLEMKHRDQTPAGHDGVLSWKRKSC